MAAPWPRRGPPASQGWPGCRQGRQDRTLARSIAMADCERISEPPAPFHVIPRGRVGASLLAMILFEKYGAHQPLN